MRFFSRQRRGLYTLSDVSATLLAHDKKDLPGGVVVQGDPPRPRKLTPSECEAVQGFPAGHTSIGWRGAPAASCPDGHRYEAVGNSMAIPVIKWLGARLLRHLTALNSKCSQNRTPTND